MKDKKCFKCGEVKPLSAFYRHKKMADGHVNKCKECNKRDVRENRKKNIDYYRDYDLARGYRQHKSYIKNYRDLYPMKWAAHKIVNNAIRDGRIKKGNKCESCGSKHRRLHGHHDDYAKPLDVRWLCPSCHKIWHLENGEAPNGA